MDIGLNLISERPYGLAGRRNAEKRLEAGGIVDLGIQAKHIHRTPQDYGIGAGFASSPRYELPRAGRNIQAVSISVPADCVRELVQQHDIPPESLGGTVD